MHYADDSYHLYRFLELCPTEQTLMPERRKVVNFVRGSNNREPRIESFTSTHTFTNADTNLFYTTNTS